MNYLGSTFCTRFLLGVLPKHLYDRDSNFDGYYKLIERLSDDLGDFSS